MMRLDRKLALGVLAAAAVGAVLGLATPWLVGRIVTDFAPAGRLDLIAWAAFGLALAGLSAALIGFVGGVMNQRLWRGWERRATLAALENLLNVQLSRMRTLSPASAVERIRGYFHAREALAAAWVIAAGSAAAFVASGGYLFYLAPLLGGAALAGLAALCALAAMLLTRQVKARIEAARRESAAAGLFAAAVRMRGALGPARARVAGRWSAANAERLSAARRAQRYRDWQAALDAALAGLAPAGLLALVAFGPARLSAGELAAAYAAFGQCLMAAYGLSWASAELTRAAEGRRVAADLPNPRAAEAPAAGPDPQAPLLRIEGLDFGFPTGAPVLRGLSLAVDPGDRVAVMGPSGVGKSTLIRLIAGLERPSAGDIRLAGAAPHLLDRADRRALIGAIASDTPRFAADRGDDLSLAAARALDHGPRLILLDEAISAEDEGFLDDLLARAAAENIAVIAVFHDADLAARFDRILRLDPV